MPLRRAVGESDTSRTFAPPARLKAARAAVELCRVVPVMCGAALAVLVSAALLLLWSVYGGWVAALLSGVVLLGAGIAALVIAILLVRTVLG